MEDRNTIFVLFDGDNKIEWGDHLKDNKDAFTVSRIDVKAHIRAVSSLDGIPFDFLVCMIDTPAGKWYRSLEAI